MSYQKPRTSLKKSQKNIILTGLLLALLITLSGTAFIIFFNGPTASTPQAAQSATGTTATATATEIAALPTPTKTPLNSFSLASTTVVPITAVGAEDGWQQKYFRYSENIAFAPSNPSIGYICGSDTPLIGSASGPIYIGITQNGGANWSMYLTPIQDSMCAISIDPLQPNDVALQTNSCSIGCSSDTPINYSLFRSTNGGREWKQLQAAGNTSFTQVFAWAGSNLYAVVNGDKPTLYVSVSGGAMQSVNMAALIKSISPTANVYISSLVSINATIYVNLYQGSCTSDTMTCTYLAASHDNGQTWTAIAYPSKTQGLTLSAIDPATGALYALNQQGAETLSVPLYTSTDGGKTWSAIPALPQSSVISQNIFIIPGNKLILLYQSYNGNFLNIYNFQTQKWVSTPATIFLSSLADIQYTADGSKIIVWGLFINQSTEQLTYITVS